MTMLKYYLCVHLAMSFSLITSIFHKIASSRDGFFEHRKNMYPKEVER